MQGKCTSKQMSHATNNKILDLSKSRAFADKKLDMTQLMEFFFDRVENIVGKDEMLFTSILSFFHHVFKRLLSDCLVVVGCIGV